MRRENSYPEWLFQVVYPFLSVVTQKYHKIMRKSYFFIENFLRQVIVFKRFRNPVPKMDIFIQTSAVLHYSQSVMVERFLLFSDKDN